MNKLNLSFIEKRTIASDELDKIRGGDCYNENENTGDCYSYNHGGGDCFHHNYLGADCQSANYPKGKVPPELQV